MLTYEQKRDKLKDALPKDSWLVDFGDDFCIYEAADGKYYRQSYALMDETITLGEKTAVEKQITYVPMTAAMRFISAAEKTDDYGFKWGVQIIESGPDKQNQFDYPLDVLHAAAAVYEGTPVFVVSEAQHTSGKHPFGKSVRDIVGAITDVQKNDTGLSGVFTILKSAQWFRDMMVDAYENGLIGKTGQKDLIALSHDVEGVVMKGAGNPKRVSKIVKVNGVDVVYDPIGGGKFLRMAAAAMQGQKEDSMFKRLLAALKGLRPDLKGQIEALEAKEDVTDEEIGKLLSAATQDKTDTEKLLAALKTDNNAVDEARKILDEARLVACGTKLNAVISASGLPKEAQEKIKAAFSGKVFADADIDAAIKSEKEYLDKLTGSGIVTGSGNVRVTESEIEARAKMLDDFFDRKLHSFKAAYIKLTGDERITGRVENAQRLTASLTTASFDQILGDSITRRLVKEYAAAGLDDWRKIVDVVPVSDFRTQRRVRFGGYGNLPAVAESGAYTALASPTDEEATYAASKRGGTEDVTVEMIKNDDVGAIRRIPQRLARAAARTLHEFVFDFLATNANIYDATALFTAGHANLGSAALDATTLAAGRRAMLKQTEAGSSKRLGIPPRYIVVPLELDKTAWDLIVAPDSGAYQPTAPDFMKTWKIEMIAVPYWTDTNNWYLVANPADIPTIEVGFMDGNETPELFVQDLPNVGSMFSNDKLTYKIRHIYGGAVVDYRGFYGAIVA